MISKKMQEAINAQINAELWSAYLYLSMSMDAADKGSITTLYSPFLVFPSA